MEEESRIKSIFNSQTKQKHFSQRECLKPVVGIATAAAGQRGPKDGGGTNAHLPHAQGFKQLSSRSGPGWEGF